jgi:hypothetical protein
VRQVEANDASGGVALRVRMPARDACSPIGFVLRDVSQDAEPHNSEAWDRWPDQ